MKLIRFVLLLVVMQPLLSWCQAPQSTPAAQTLRRRYLRPIQKPPVFTDSVVFEEIPVVTPTALRPSAKEIMENLAQYTVHPNEIGKPENMERLVYALIFFSRTQKLSKPDCFTFLNSLKCKFGPILYQQFIIQLNQELARRDALEREAQPSAPMNKKQKSSEQE